MVPNRAAESRKMVPGFTGATLREWSWQRLGAESARFGMPRMKIKFAHRSCGCLLCRFSYICVSFSSVAVKKFDTYCMELGIHSSRLRRQSEAALDNRCLVLGICQAQPAFLITCYLSALDFKQMPSSCSHVWVEKSLQHKIILYIFGWNCNLTCFQQRWLLVSHI